MPFLGGRAQASRGYFGGGTTPDAPTGLVATKSNSQISVAFTAPVFDGGLPITTYQFALSTDGFTTFTTRSTGTTASPLVITGLTNGTSIEVKLRAVNSLGAGAASVASTAVTPSTVPDAPATPTVNALNAGDTITWTTPANGGSAITGYYYKVSTNNGASYGAETFVAAGATLSYATGNQYSTSTFKIQVRAENTNGSSGFSTASANTVAWQNQSQVQSNPTACPAPTCSACTAPDCSGGCGSCAACGACDCGTSSITGSVGTRTATAGTRAAPTLGTSSRTCYRWARSGSTASGYVYAQNSISDCGAYSTCTASTCGECAAGSCSACSASTCGCSACGTVSTVSGSNGQIVYVGGSAGTDYRMYQDFFGMWAVTNSGGTYTMPVGQCGGSCTSQTCFAFSTSVTQCSSTGAYTAVGYAQRGACGNFGFGCTASGAC